MSEFGVYDQIGNAWEWVDLKQTASRETWTSLLHEHGFVVSVSDQRIEMEPRLLSRLRLQTICVDMKRMSLEAGVLTVQLNQDISVAVKVEVKGICGSTLLIHVIRELSYPTGKFVPDSKILGKNIVWDQERDGEAVGAKVGGSFYSGAQMTLQDFWIGHIPSFNGSIGFRCSFGLA